MRLWPRRHGTSLDLLVAGLGNPGREYARNRHNVGWLVVDELARRHGGSWRAKFNGQLAEIRIDGHKVALLKPELFMNESGRPVRAAMQFFKLDPDAVLVVHDEGDLELGRLQARLGGGAAGHNGLRSIQQHLGTYEGKKVVVKEISEPVGDFRILLAWPKGTRLNQRARAFVDFCQERHRRRSGSA